MAKFKDKMWIWGHDAGSHNDYNLPIPSKMSPLEGAMYLGVPNMCRVVYNNMPEPPFERDALALDALDNVVWSIIGESLSSRNYGGQSDIDAIVEVAKVHKNIIGGIMDDIFQPPRIAGYTPAMLAGYKKRLSEGAGRDMQLWTVVYAHELNDMIVPFLDECDVTTLWTWKSSDILRLEENFNKFRALWGCDRPLYGGCYLWGYGDGGNPFPLDLLGFQLDIYCKWLNEHKIDGVIFCSNNVCDIGLEAVQVVRNWIYEHKNEELVF